MIKKTLLSLLVFSTCIFNAAAISVHSQNPIDNFISDVDVRDLFSDQALHERFSTDLHPIEESEFTRDIREILEKLDFKDAQTINIYHLKNNIYYQSAVLTHKALYIQKSIDYTYESLPNILACALVYQQKGFYKPHRLYAALAQCYSTYTTLAFWFGFSSPTKRLASELHGGLSFVGNKAGWQYISGSGAMQKVFNTAPVVSSAVAALWHSIVYINCYNFVQDLASATHHEFCNFFWDKMIVKPAEQLLKEKGFIV